jgi:hypothetical protein
MFSIFYLCLLSVSGGTRYFVVALRYKPECRCFDSLWLNLSGRTSAVGVDAASNSYDYQGYFVGVKAAGA